MKTCANCKHCEHDPNWDDYLCCEEGIILSSEQAHDGSEVCESYELKKGDTAIDRTFIYVLVLALVGLASSWSVTCGLIKLVTVCFGWGFNWLIATAIWGTMCTITLGLVMAGRGN